MANVMKQNPNFQMMRDIEDLASKIGYKLKIPTEWK
jgi:hypothetical protein